MAYLNHEHYNDPTAGALFKKERKTYIDPKLTSGYRPSAKTLVLREKTIKQAEEIQRARALKAERKRLARRNSLATIGNACENMNLKIMRYEQMIEAVAETAKQEVTVRRAREAARTAREAIKEFDRLIREL